MSYHPDTLEGVKAFCEQEGQPCTALDVFLTNDHIVEMKGEEGWSLEHPARCREGGASLHDCPVHKATWSIIPTPGIHGRFRVKVNDNGIIVWGDRVDA
jgi:hypothetical protein